MEEEEKEEESSSTVASTYDAVLSAQWLSGDLASVSRARAAALGGRSFSSKGAGPAAQ